MLYLAELVCISRVLLLIKNLLQTCCYLPENLTLVTFPVCQVLLKYKTTLHLCCTCTIWFMTLGGLSSHYSILSRCGCVLWKALMDLPCWRLCQGLLSKWFLVVLFVWTASFHQSSAHVHSLIGISALGREWVSGEHGLFSQKCVYVCVCRALPFINFWHIANEHL